MTTSGGPRKILVVDDDPQVVEVLRRSLETRPGEYLVQTASNGAEAVASVLRDPPDLVLLDISMPGMDGLEVLKQISRINSDIAVMMVTANTDFAPGEALHLGAFAYIPKPLDLSYIDQLVPLALTNRRVPPSRVAKFHSPAPPAPVDRPTPVEPPPDTPTPPPPAPTPPPEAQAAHARGLAAYRAHRWPAAVTAFEQATTLEPTYTQAWQDLGRTLEHLGRWPEALRAQEAAYLSALQQDDEAAQGVSLRWIGNVHLNRGDAAAALSHYERALALAEKTADGSEQARALCALGHVHDALGRTPEALTHYARALSLAEAVGDAPAQTRALAALGTAHRDAGRPAEGLDYCQRALALAEQRADAPLQAPLLNLVGRLLLDAGRHPEAADHLQRAVALAARLGDDKTLAQTFFHIGLLCSARGWQPDALDYYSRALTIADRLGMAERDGFREYRDHARAASLPSAEN